MDKFLKDAKVGATLTAIFSIGLGIVLVVYPQMSSTVICYALGAILVFCAFFHVFFYFKYKNENSFINLNIIIAVISGVIGVWIIMNPAMVTMIIPIIFGIVLIIHAIIDIKYAIELKEKYYEYWWIALILTTFNIGFALVLFVNPFVAVTTLIVVIGISLVYDGISDIWIISRISKAVRDIKKSLDTINEE